jgi:hypothetical protein
MPPAVPSARGGGDEEERGGGVLTQVGSWWDQNYECQHTQPNDVGHREDLNSAVIPGRRMSEMGGGGGNI